MTHENRTYSLTREECPSPNGHVPPVLGQPRKPESTSECTFAILLDALVSDRGLSNPDLAQRTHLEQSYFSRLRNGNRLPSRAAVLAIAEALGLGGPERDRLLDAAGLMPVDRAYLLRDEPTVAGLYRLLSDPEIDERRRETARNVVAALIGESE